MLIINHIQCLNVFDTVTVANTTNVSRSPAVLKQNSSNSFQQMGSSSEPLHLLNNCMLIAALLTDSEDDARFDLIQCLSVSCATIHPLPLLLQLVVVLHFYRVTSNTGIVDGLRQAEHFFGDMQSTAIYFSAVRSNPDQHTSTSTTAIRNILFLQPHAMTACIRSPICWQFRSQL